MFVPPFNDVEIMSGQGAFGLEIFEQSKNVQTVIISIRGGGPCAGVCLPIKSLIPNCRTFAVSGAKSPNIYIKCQKEKNRKIDPIA